MIESKSKKNMVHSGEELDAMLDAAKPLMKWLNDNSNVNSTILVTPDSVELLWAIGIRSTDEFVLD